MTTSDKERKFQELMSAHSERILRLCRGFTDQPVDVKDLYQEVIINVWKGMKGFRAEAASSTWIHRITINTCLLWKKKGKRWQKEKETYGAEPRFDSQPELNEVTPELQALRKAIQQLKTGERTILLLYLEELSYKEIAKITGLSLSNIGVKINRAKSNLKNLMTEN